MNSSKKQTALLVVLMMSFIINPAISRADIPENQPIQEGNTQLRIVPELKTGMTQGDIAKRLAWAIEALGPQSMGPGTHTKKPLAPASQAKDAIKFFEEGLNLAPEGGWKEKEEMTKQALASILGYPDIDAKDKELIEQYLNGSVEDSFKKLSGLVEEYAKGRYDNRKTAVFRPHAATPYLPPV